MIHDNQEKNCNVASYVIMMDYSWRNDGFRPLQRSGWENSARSSSQSDCKICWITTTHELRKSKSPKKVQQSMLSKSVLSFVSRLSHLGCRSRRFDCLLLVFFRRSGPLIARHHFYHKDRLWLVHFESPIVPLFRREAVPSAFPCCNVFLLLIILIVGIHASGSLIPLSLLMLLRVKSYVKNFHVTRMYQWRSRSINLTSFQIE